MKKYTPRPDLAKKLLPISYVLSVVVIGLIAAMGPMNKIQTDIDFSFLPVFHSTMNACTFVLLLVALYFVKKGNIEAHKKTIMVAMVASSFFLVSYVVYHMTTPHTNYGGKGFIRIVYFTLLNTHIVLSGIVFPFILISFIRGISYQIEKHKKLVRWVYPIWLYVAISGPILFLMLRPYR